MTQSSSPKNIRNIIRAPARNPVEASAQGRWMGRPSEPPKVLSDAPHSLPLKITTTNPQRLIFFVTTPRGLETILAEEISEIATIIGESVNVVDIAEGGVACEGNLALGFAINLFSRVANRVLWRVASGFYHDDRDIYAFARAIDWSVYFRVHKTIRVDTVAVFSPLKSIAIATLRAKDGICDRFRQISGERPSVDKSHAEIRIRLYIEKRQVQFYLDLSGDPLFKRGYRRELSHPMVAPIRENLASGLLSLSGAKKASLIFDPFCGSGTFLIEAAHLILQRANFRPFALEHLNAFNPQLWESLVAKARARAIEPCEYFQRTQRKLPTLMGADADPRAIEAARVLFRHFGWQDWIQSTQGDFLAMPAPTIEDEDHPLLIANPPYGERMGSLEELATLYPLWGRHLKHAYQGWQTAWVSADLQMAKGFGLRPQKKWSMFNGDLPVQFFTLPLFAGKRAEFLAKD